jgi:hypothetical protein
MAKALPSKLDAHADVLAQWFGEEKLSLAEARKRLAALGCEVSASRLSDWWSRRQGEDNFRHLLEGIGSGARAQKEFEAALDANPAPELRRLIELHRRFIFTLSTQRQLDKETIEAVATLMRPVVDFAKLEEKRKERELSEQKYRDLVNEKRAAIERELNSAKTSGGITPETLEKIERELKLL